MDKAQNWMVIVRRGDVVELRGIYPTKRAATFIGTKIKISDKLKVFPQITPTTADIIPKGNKVEEYLCSLDNRNNVMAHRKKVIKYLPTSG